jgi:hypothetical protein
MQRNTGSISKWRQWRDSHEDRCRKEAYRGITGVKWLPFDHRHERAFASL